MEIGSVHIDLVEVATCLVTLYGGFSVWSVRKAKAQALIKAGRASEVDSSLPGDPLPPPGGSNGTT